MLERNAVIVGGNRTPFVKVGGAYASASAQDLLTAALDGLVARFGLAVPREGPFHVNIGAIRLVEAICRKSAPAFLSEHSSDPIIPREMPFLAKGLEATGWPREIRLTAHSEYTIRFSHLEQVARAFGRKVETGSLLEWVGYANAEKARFVFNARACSTDEQALIATSLLALSNDMGRVSVSMFAATQMFDCSEAEWGETVQSLVDAGLVDAAWAGRRVDLAWRGMNQQRGS